MEGRRGATERRTLRSALVGALVGLVLMVAPSGASAVPDAGCPGPSNVVGSLSPLGDRREAQTFTAINTGALQRAQVLIRNISANDPDFLVQILATDGNGVPVNNALASATIPKTSVPTGITTLDAAFSPAAIVSAGQQYAVAISRPGANFLVPTWQIPVRAGNACPGGTFFSFGPTDGWSPEGIDVDMIFQTFVEPGQVTAGGGGGGGKNAGFTLVTKRGRLFAKVPGPGRLIADDAKKSARRARKARRPNLVKRTKAKAKKAGLVPLRIELTNRAVRLALKRRKLNILAAVTYRPTGGEPSTLTFRIRIRL
jgi:hypothetical protein